MSGKGSLTAKKSNTLGSIRIQRPLPSAKHQGKKFLSIARGGRIQDKGRAQGGILRGKRVNTGVPAFRRHPKSHEKRREKRRDWAGLGWNSSDLRKKGQSAIFTRCYKEKVRQRQRLRRIRPGPAEIIGCRSEFRSPLCRGGRGKGGDPYALRRRKGPRIHWEK